VDGLIWAASMVVLDPTAGRDGVISAEDPCITEVQAPYSYTIPPRCTDLPR
jgi:hypothetical protein